MKKIPYLIVFLCFSLLELNAQTSHSCGTTIEEQATTYDFVQEQRTRPVQSISRNTPIEVPIKIHIMGSVTGAFAIDSSLVLDELALVNEAYAEIDIVFTLCGPINYIFNNSYVTFIKTIDEIICEIHDVDGAINVYIPPNIEKEDGEGICGYAYNFDVKPRVFLDKGCATNGSTFTHELGHAFSLKHTHSTSEGEELANGSNCSVAGDLLCDTPADPRLSSDLVNDDCEYIGTDLDNQQNPYNPDTGNYMSYAPKECRDHFSQEQLIQMEDFYNDRGFFLDCFDSPTPTNDFDLINAIQVYPNPSQSSVFIDKGSGEMRVELLDATGKSLLKKKYSEVSETIEITEFENFKQGIYFLKITIKDQMTTKRIVRF